MFSTLRSGGAGAEIASRSGRGVESSGVCSEPGAAGAGAAGSRVGCVGGSVGSGGSVGTVPSSWER